MHHHDTHALHAAQPQPLPPLPSTAGKRGRPPKADALSDAERARRYRVRKKARLAELRVVKQAADAIVPEVPWRRRWAEAAALMGRARTALSRLRAVAWRLRS